MHIFISIIMLIISACALGTATSHYPHDTQYFPIIISTIIYAIVSIIRECKNAISDKWDANDYSHRQTSYSNPYTQNGYRNQYTVQPRNEKVKYKKIPIKPSHSEVRRELQKLETNRWWRFKRNICAFFSYDITQKLYEPRLKKIPIVVTDNYAKYQPKIATTNNNTIWGENEYELVSKLISRTCTISIDKKTE